MTQLLLFLGFSMIALLMLIVADYFKKVSFKSLIGLFLFGVLISIPFILIEFMGGHLKYYIVILSFIAIELGILFSEHRIKYFHDLISHNTKDLRILSFLLIGLGFTYSEITFTILHSHGEIGELMHMLPFKALYALLTHTVLTSAASLTHLGNLFSETIYETIIKLFSYYSRITLISVSHYLYVFSIEHNLILLIIALLAGSMVSFFLLKKQLDAKTETI